MVVKLAAIAPPSFFHPLPHSTSTPNLHTSESNSISCNICTGILDQPIEFGCGNIVCLQCCTRWLTISDNLDCPCCQSSIQDHAHTPSRITMDILGKQLIDCSRGCNRVVQANQYITHINSQCKASFEHSIRSPSRMTVQQLLEKGNDTPTTATEKKVAKNIISRLMAEQDDHQILQLPTRGQVHIHTSITLNH